MKIPEVKRLVETYTLAQLQAAEEALAEEQKPEIEIEGSDEGEKLTHAYAAIWILQKMDKEGTDFKTALREFTGKVRKSIS